MAEVLVDTDILIDFSRGMTATAQYFQASTQGSLAISSVTQMELIVGCQDKRALRMIDRFLTRFQVFPVTPEITNQTIDLLHEYNLSHGLLIPDALIASTALMLDLPFMTRNQRDFRFIPNLTLLPPPGS